MNLQGKLKIRNENLQQELFRMLALYAGQWLLRSGRRKGGKPWRLISGGLLLYIGATGKIPFIPWLQRINKNHGQFNCKYEIVVQQPPAIVFSYFRDFRNLKKHIPCLKSAKPLDIEKTHWELTIEILGKSCPFELFVVKERINEFLGWSANEDAFLYHTGRIELREGVIPNITVLDLVFSYTPPGGNIGRFLTSPFQPLIRSKLRLFLDKLRKEIEEEIYLS